MGHATQKKSDATGSLYGLLVSLPLSVSDADISAAIQPEFAKTLPEVARAFGKSPNTIQHSWRAAGMPGKSGRWPLLEILLWRRRHEHEVAVKRGNLSGASEREIERRQLEAETRKIELQADRLEREEQIAMGNLVPADSVVQLVSGLSAAHVKHMQQMADDLAPTFPQDTAPEYVRAIRLQVDRRLTAFAEALARDLLRGTD